jgi:pimeloyl-ACP methyl ester carboxylesterase
MLNPEFTFIENDGLRLRVALAGSGPLILCVHGWPELWYSWRHQMAYFSSRGYRVAAMDVRGYGGSDKPEAVEAYTLQCLASDAAAVLEALTDEPAVLVGHDWGAPVVYQTALRYPDRVSAVAGLSVPFRPASDVFMLDVMAQVYADRFFYMEYFQQEELPEREFEADVAGSLRRVYFAASGDADPDIWYAKKPKSAGMLDGMPDPDPFPGWMTPADLAVYAESFAAGGFRGPVNRYRAQEIDFRDSRALVDRKLAQPACFIGGERDIVRHMIPGMDMYDGIVDGYDNLCLQRLLPGVGHWVQQEAPDESNAALHEFLECLD